MKTVQTAIRLTAAQKEALDKLAQREHTNPSEIIREAE